MKNRRKPLYNKAKRPSIKDRRIYDDNILSIFIAFLVGTLLLFLAVI